MPLTLTLTEGVLPAGQEKVAYQRLSDAMLRWHGLTGNKTMTRNVVGSLHVLPKGATFTGGEETDVAFVEWKVPSFAFADPAVQKGYWAEATGLLHDMSGGRLPKDQIFVNVVHSVDGGWNFDGQRMTNDEIKAALSAG